MALTNLMTAITLDVYDHNATQTSIKSISCDSNTRFVRAALTYAHVPYKVSVNAAVALTVVRPDGAAVNIEGEAYNSGSANTDRIVAELCNSCKRFSSCSVQDRGRQPGFKNGSLQDRQRRCTRH